jgi:hypothetical protein
MGVGYVEGWSKVWQKVFVELWVGRKPREGNGRSWKKAQSDLIPIKCITNNFIIYRQ